MPFVSAVCPTCGGQLEVDNGKEAGICKFCVNAFITEKAINNYHIKYEIKADTIVMNNKDSMEDLFERESVYQKISDIPRLQETYETMTELYPTRHEGWWGKITLGTNGFTDLTVDMQEIEKWFGLVCEAAPKDVLPALEKKYHSYIVERMKLTLAQKQAELQQSDADDEYQQECYKNSIKNSRRAKDSTRTRVMIHLGAIGACIIGVLLIGNYLGTEENTDDIWVFVFLALIGGGIALLVKLVKSEDLSDLVNGFYSPERVRKDFADYQKNHSIARNSDVASIDELKKQIEDYAEVHGIAL